MKLIGFTIYLPFQFVFSYVVAPCLILVLLLGGVILLCIIGGKDIRTAFLNEFISFRQYSCSEGK
ncbi:hypothetical protein EES38_13125 [Vibrio viridaestus]|uniref:Uncharacterized protein n=1 Tax=Vibrio viridaestus TaxID=2487322 RepID=A0A3N9U0A4_9VIBR|nr:hypothetical protein EES38_13125 [Vibrio viridaestus]